MNAREFAFKVICDIETNKNYSNISINKHFKNIEIKNAERGFATELIYGVVENKYYIDYIINKLSKIKVKKMSTFVKTILRMGTYQILFLDSISDYAAVDESVKLAKKYDKRSSGFVNAILRNEIRNKETIKNIDEKDEVKALSIKYSYNPWMVQNWIEKFGLDFTKDLLEENSKKPNLYIRVNTTKTTRDELIEKLTKMGVECSKISFIEEAVEVKNLKNIENNELFNQGLFTIQDISSMIVGKTINPKENSLVLDVCSAPGGKTTHVATIMNNTGKVVARDIFNHKLKLIKSSVTRLGLNNVDVEEYDALKFDEKSVDKFDYVLTDVPCSGLGIVKRKPEIKFKEKEDLKELPAIQRKILDNASKYVKIGGTLVYSTCTIQDEENINVVKAFLKDNEGFKLDPIDSVEIDLEEQNSGVLKIYPNVHAMDGFFIAKLVRVR
ncbi:16S rRNA (cytosine(967)-C(5))-methyltransferase RsmB [Metaclostridioides mangenotii]|uniref:16S rRNA (cytosine(967)-C(5))-methyltransferase n=1 Tax=Metaclostridioides mangenotii TaxID=1540 RepID=A0ABS4E9X5_9FIRM|nr:16S rRNA (cytosine(967)-C(5))-methyltransferase RsmB [Clostridioides mangenotii]MBP1854732.1 16S rRNA (cytosine967-C5)-methyltransferase [Clostridioides mangenotii]